MRFRVSFRAVTKRSKLVLPGLISGAALTIVGMMAGQPAMASLDAARTFAHDMVEELGLEVSDCGKKFLATNTGEEHVCGRTDLPLRKFSAAWDVAARKRAPRGVKQLGLWGKSRGDAGHGLQYEIQGTPLAVGFFERSKRVTISYSDYSWNEWPCVDGRYDGLGEVFDADKDGEITLGKLTGGGPPEYPELARGARLQGSLELEALVDEQGRVQEVCVIRPYNRGVGFEAQGVETVRQWTYEPALRGGVPVKFFLKVKLEFKLH